MSWKLVARYALGACLLSFALICVDSPPRPAPNQSPRGDGHESKEGNSFPKTPSPSEIDEQIKGLLVLRGYSLRGDEDRKTLISLLLSETPSPDQRPMDWLSPDDGGFPSWQMRLRSTTPVGEHDPENRPCC